MQPVKLSEMLTHHTIVAVGAPSGACNFIHQNFDDWWWTFDAITVTLNTSAASVRASQRNYTLAACRGILNKSDPRGTDRISFQRGTWLNFITWPSGNGSILTMEGSLCPLVVHLHNLHSRWAKKEVSSFFSSPFRPFWFAWQATSLLSSNLIPERKIGHKAIFPPQIS